MIFGSNAASLPLSSSLFLLLLPLLLFTTLSFPVLPRWRDKRGRQQARKLPLIPECLSIELGELRREEDGDLPQSRFVPPPVAAAASPLRALPKQAPPPAVSPLRELGVAQPEPALGRAQVAGALGGAVGARDAAHDGGERGADEEAVRAELRASPPCEQRGGEEREKGGVSEFPSSFEPGRKQKQAQQKQAHRNRTARPPGRRPSRR